MKSLSLIEITKINEAIFETYWLDYRPNYNTSDFSKFRYNVYVYKNKDPIFCYNTNDVTWFESSKKNIWYEMKLLISKRYFNDFNLSWLNIRLHV